MGGRCCCRPPRCADTNARFWLVVISGFFFLPRERRGAVESSSGWEAGRLSREGLDGLLHGLPNIVLLEFEIWPFACKSSPIERKKKVTTSVVGAALLLIGSRRRRCSVYRSSPLDPCVAHGASLCRGKTRPKIVAKGDLDSARPLNFKPGGLAHTSSLNGTAVFQPLLLSLERLLTLLLGKLGGRLDADAAVRVQSCFWGGGR